MSDETHCDAHSGFCIRIKHLEKGQSIMDEKLDKVWYIMIATLASVIVTGVGVYLNLITKAVV
jgi:hypothetical protein